MVSTHCAFDYLSWHHCAKESPNETPTHFPFILTPLNQNFATRKEKSNEHMQITDLCFLPCGLHGLVHLGSGGERTFAQSSSFIHHLLFDQNSRTTVPASWSSNKECLFKVHSQILISNSDSILSIIFLDLKKYCRTFEIFWPSLIYNRYVFPLIMRNQDKYP